MLTHGTQRNDEVARDPGRSSLACSRVCCGAKPHNACGRCRSHAIGRSPRARQQKPIPEEHRRHTKQLAQAPANSRVIVIGITDHSFTQPDILLSAEISAETSYFGERLNSARRQLVIAWKSQSAKLQPRYQLTDIMGALLLAAHMFHPDAKSRSKDSRHIFRHAPLYAGPKSGVDLSSPSFSQMSSQQTSVMPDLRRVRVFILGVDGTGNHWLLAEPLRVLDAISSVNTG